MQRGKAVLVLSKAPAAGSVTVPHPQHVAPQALPSPRGCRWSQVEKQMSKACPGPALKTRLEGRAFLLPEQHLSSSGPGTAQAAWKRESKGKLRPGGLSLALHPAFRLFPTACRQGGGRGAGGDEHPAPVPQHPRSPDTPGPRAAASLAAPRQHLSARLRAVLGSNCLPQSAWF